VTVSQIIQQLEAAGGVLTLNDGRVLYDVPKKAAPLVDVLRHHRAEVLHSLEVREKKSKRDVSDWLAVRCIVTKNPVHAWGSEKHLYRDYSAWCQQASQTACIAKTFARIMTGTFRREANGWLGVCLAQDWTASKLSHINAGRC